MTNPSIIQLIAAADGQATAEVIANAFAGTPRVRVDRDLAELPADQVDAVLVFVLSPNALTDPEYQAVAADAGDSLLPKLAVVPDLGFPFRDLTGTLAFLAGLNAVPWNYQVERGLAPGQRAIRAIRQLLGLAAFEDEMKVFISYARADGEAVAELVHDHFRSLHYQVFKDTEDGNIRFGAPFQERIHQAIPERDLVLLIDSPAARQSRWVREEALVALDKRVTVIALQLPAVATVKPFFPGLEGTARIHWSGTDPAGDLAALQAMLERELGERSSLDQRVRRIVQSAATVYRIKSEELDLRRLLLRRDKDKTRRRCVLEYENARYDLVRLYRLHRGMASLPRGPIEGLLVHGAERLTDEECRMVDWVGGNTRMRVVAVDELFPVLSEFGASAP